MGAEMCRRDRSGSDSGSDDDDGDSSEWGSGDDASDSSDSEAGAYSDLKGRARWLKKNTVVTKKEKKRQEGGEKTRDVKEKKDSGGLLYTSYASDEKNVCR